MERKMNMCKLDDRPYMYAQIYLDWKNPWPKCMHCCKVKLKVVQGLPGVNQRSDCLAMPHMYGYQEWLEGPLTKVYGTALLGSKDMQGSAWVNQLPEVKLLRNALWPPDVVDARALEHMMLQVL